MREWSWLCVGARFWLPMLVLNIYYKEKKLASFKQTLQVFPAGELEQNCGELLLLTIQQSLMKITRCEHARE